jgi:hypothetical protein
MLPDERFAEWRYDARGNRGLARLTQCHLNSYNAFPSIKPSIPGFLVAKKHHARVPFNIIRALLT